MTTIKKIDKSKLVTVRKSVVNKKTKSITQFRPMILSRHPSHDCLRANTKNITPLPYRSVVRFGSTTEVPDTIAMVVIELKLILYKVLKIQQINC